MSDTKREWIEFTIPTGHLCQFEGVKNLKRIDGGTTSFIEIGAVRELERINAKYADIIHRVATAEKQKSERLIAALEFYGDKKNWREWYDSVAICDSDTELSDYVHQASATEYGGKRAREAIAEYHGVTTEVDETK